MTDENKVDNLEEEVRDFIAEQIGIDKEKVNLDSNFVKDLGADSLDLAEMVMQLEDRYNIDVPDEDTGKLQTPKDVVDYIRQYRAG